MNLHFFLTKSDAGGFPNIYPRSPIVLELSNGLLLGGNYERHPADYFPRWIIPPHHEIGQYKVFLHAPQYTWTSDLREQHINSDIGNGVPLHLYIKSSNGRQISAIHFHLVDILHDYNFVGLGVYVAMPDGSVYTSHFQ